MEATMRTLQVTLPAPSKRREVLPVGYYQSEQFYHDLESAEQDIANGKGLRVSSKQELDALFA